MKLVRECECKMEALMGRRKGRLSAVYGLLKKEGEYTAVAVEQDDAKAKERTDFVPLGKRPLCAPTSFLKRTQCAANMRITLAYVVFLQAICSFECSSNKNIARYMAYFSFAQTKPLGVCFIKSPFYNF